MGLFLGIKLELIAVMKTCLTILIAVLISLGPMKGHASGLAKTQGALNYIRENNITEYDDDTNKEISKKFSPYFSALVFKTLIEKQSRNKELRSLLHQQMNQRIVLNKKLANTILVINMGLGWDDQNFSNQAFYIQNFITEIKLLGLETHFLKRDPYGPIDHNIELIKPQLHNLLRTGKNIILLSLCKGTPELVVAMAEEIEENPKAQKQITGYLNMSGMLGGTIFSKKRLDLKIIEEIEQSLDGHLKTTPVRLDRLRTVRALPYMTSDEIAESLTRLNNFQMRDLEVINVVGAMTSKYISQKGSPLKLFLTYNEKAHLFPYANDGFLDISQTSFSKDLFPKARTLVLESTHLLADGNFDQYDLANKGVRISFYRALFQALIK